MTNGPTPISAQDAQEILAALRRIQAGDFAYDQVPQGGEGTYGEIISTVEQLLHLINGFAGELTRLARELGWEGRFGGQMEVANAEGDWKHMVENLNHMAYHLTDQLRDLSNVTHSYSQGDFSRRATVRCDGETRELLASLNSVGQRMHAS